MSSILKAVALIALVNSAIVSDGRSQSTPATNSQFMRASGAELIETLKLRKLDNSRPIEKEIGSIADALPLGNVHIPAIWVCDGCGTSSHPSLGIIVDTGQLEHIRTQYQISDLHRLLVFVVAHEAAHQLQFATYRRDIYTLPRAERLYYEAQADILAGLWLYQDTRINKQGDQWSTERTWHAIFDLGVEEYAIADHPSHTARLYAAKQGMGLGAARNEVTHPTFPGIDLGDPLRKFGLQDGETDLAFSLRMARSIVAFDPSAALDLMRISSDIDSKDDGKGNINYRLTYANRGAHTLHVALEVVCLYESQRDPEDPFRTMQFSSNAHNFTVAPRGQSHISGQISCPSLPGSVTTIEYPPSRYGLIEVRYADGNDSTVGSKDLNVARVDMNELADVPGSDEGGFKVAFDRYLQFSRDGYRDLSTGPAVFYQDVGKYFYNTALAVPGAVNSRVEIDKRGHASVWNILSKTTDSDTSAAQYRHVVDLVRAALNDTIVPGGSGKWEETASGDADLHGTYFKQFPYTVLVLHSKVPVSIPHVEGAFYYELDVDWSGTPPKSK